MCFCVRICMCLPAQRGVLDYVCECLCYVHRIPVCDPLPSLIYPNVYHSRRYMCHTSQTLSYHEASLTQRTADSALPGTGAAHRVFAVVCSYASILNSTSDARNFLAPVKNVKASTGAWPGGST